MFKKLLIIPLAVFLLFSSPGIASADCIPGVSGCSGNYSTSCNAGGVSMCCSDPASCSSLQGQSSSNSSSNSNSNSNSPVNSGSQVNSNSSANVHGSCGDTSIDTAIGCVPVLGDRNEFVAFILRWAIGVGSGIAFLLIVYAGFMIMTSSGNPERLKAGQELMTSAISGLVLLVASVFILNVIGVKILAIPGLGG